MSGKLNINEMELYLCTEHYCLLLFWFSKDKAVTNTVQLVCVVVVVTVVLTPYKAVTHSWLPDLSATPPGI